MIGPALMERLASCPYTFPILAGAGVGSTAAFAVVDWTKVTGQATAALALAGLVGGSVVGGIVYVINHYDKVKINRQKLYDEANKDSLSQQMAESLANQEKMRQSLHQLRNDAAATHSENHELRDDLATLRKQFMEVSKQLHETDLLLHAARREMHETAARLTATAAELQAAVRDRDALQGKLDAILRSQVSQGERIVALESVGQSGDSISAVKAPTEAPR